MNSMFLVWHKYHRRSELLAEAFGATVHYVYDGRTVGGWRTGLRYLSQARQTWRLLSTERPRLIFIQNPPIFAVAVAALYVWRFRAAYIINSHSGAFNSAKWRWSIGLHRLLSRHALLTIVHNSAQEAIVMAWGYRYEVVGYTPGNYDLGQARRLGGAYNVIFVSTFSADEPLPLVIEAARMLLDVTFHITGDASRLDSAVRAGMPSNVKLTGYLTYEDYVSLLKSADAILALTTRDQTLSMAGFEAVALARPLIVSDWPVLADYFDEGTVHIPNTADGIVAGIQQARQDQARLQLEMIDLRTRLTAAWEVSRARIATLVQAREALARRSSGSGLEEVTHG